MTAASGSKQKLKKIRETNEVPKQRVFSYDPLDFSAAMEASKLEKRAFKSVLMDSDVQVSIGN